MSGTRCGPVNSNVKARGQGAAAAGVRGHGAVHGQDGTRCMYERVGMSARRARAGMFDTDGSAAASTGDQGQETGDAG
jgi:hypothetical protein